MGWLGMFIEARGGELASITCHSRFNQNNCAHPIIGHQTKREDGISRSLIGDRQRPDQVGSGQMSMQLGLSYIAQHKGMLH